MTDLTTNKDTLNTDQLLAIIHEMEWYCECLAGGEWHIEACMGNWEFKEVACGDTFPEAMRKAIGVFIEDEDPEQGENEFQIDAQKQMRDSPTWKEWTEC